MTPAVVALYDTVLCSQARHPRSAPSRQGLDQVRIVLLCAQFRGPSSFTNRHVLTQHRGPGQAANLPLGAWSLLQHAGQDRHSSTGPGPLCSSHSARGLEQSAALQSPRARGSTPASPAGTGTPGALRVREPLLASASHLRGSARHRRASCARPG
ncbi:hypothetical protein NDU88_009928 [Pleurodeles waltl]|uniref:Uncharacterized protein n=1 Tax=Pleurodeles waltl TaxID=8319 RepID=A0AAV7S1S7_PLEWA|nr:hypothetical protein NDU88_009928 [Pleurodeles waltl]